MRKLCCWRRLSFDSLLSRFTSSYSQGPSTLPRRQTTSLTPWLSAFTQRSPTPNCPALFNRNNYNVKTWRWNAVILEYSKIIDYKPDCCQNRDNEKCPSNLEVRDPSCPSTDERLHYGAIWNKKITITTWRGNLTSDKLGDGTTGIDFFFGFKLCREMSPTPSCGSTKKLKKIRVVYLSPMKIGRKLGIFVQYIIGHLFHEPCKALAIEPLLHFELLGNVTHIKEAGHRLTSVEEFFVLFVKPNFNHSLVILDGRKYRV